MEKKDYRLISMPSAMCHVSIERSAESCADQPIEVNLWSYYTNVLTISFSENQRLELYATGTYSATTARHINRFTKEFFGENLYHSVKCVCSKSDEELPLVLAIDCTTNKSAKEIFFKALERYSKYGKRFYDYTKSEKERFNAHRWGW